LLPQTPVFPPIGQPFIVLASVDSSNNYAMAQARAGMASPGTVYFAMEQTMGKGQRGKQWITRPGENIMISAIVQSKVLTVGKQFILSAATALGCYDFFKKYAGEDDTKIKWPNDLYWQDRKAGGILIESGKITPPGESSKLSAESPFYIVGIGININQTRFDPQVKNPVSLKQITGRNWDVLDLAKELCGCLSGRYAQLSLSDHSIIAEYMKAFYKLNERVRLKKESAVFETTICGVTNDGKLLTKDTLDREFDFGEVEWLLAQD
jgi:BirA family transcriptional regulator, biotin operon repressor / biotin---[acetyl-CoA-carboxylase] ligase